ncbi:glycosyltransferase, partial [Patescibacteria group bacterium]|nr:glycosyltransferase [Patescibacteria group bacterium]
MKKIWANILVQNEERYVWYAIMSVVNHVDKVLVWDTGSTDRTVEIIKEIKKRNPKKIDFKQVVQKDIVHYTELRQQMLEATKANWIILVDGDEIWWDESMKLL